MTRPAEGDKPSSNLEAILLQAKTAPPEKRVYKDDLSRLLDPETAKREVKTLSNAEIKSAMASIAPQAQKCGHSKKGLVATIKWLIDISEKAGVDITKSFRMIEAKKALVAMKDDVEDFGNTVTATFDASGVAMEQYGKAAETTTHKFNKAVKKLNATLISLGSITLPAVTKAMGVLDAVISKVTKDTVEKDSLKALIKYQKAWKK